MTPRIVVPDGDEPVRHLRRWWYVLGTSEDISLEVVSDEAVTEVELFTSEADSLQVDTPDSSGFIALGTYPDGGVSLGAFTAGQRKAITVRIAIPSGAAVAHRLFDLKLGTGIDE